MPEGTPAAACQLCGGSVSKKNTSGFCRKNPECAKASQAVAQKRWYETHKEQVAEKWAAYSSSYRGRRAELDHQRWRESHPEVQRTRRPNGSVSAEDKKADRKNYEARQSTQPGYAEMRRARAQEFKTRPENAERVREYNRRGREKYMARADRPCLFPDGCSDHAKVGSKFCAEHGRIESARHLRRATARRKKVLAERQAWTCPWCSQQLPQALTRTHVDHIIPRCSGLVIEEEWNFQLLHARCNQEKSGTITPQALALAAEHGLSFASFAAENRFTAALRV